MHTQISVATHRTGWCSFLPWQPRGLTLARIEGPETVEVTVRERGACEITPSTDVRYPPGTTNSQKNHWLLIGKDTHRQIHHRYWLLFISKITIQWQRQFYPSQPCNWYVRHCYTVLHLLTTTTSVKTIKRNVFTITHWFSVPFKWNTVKMLLCAISSSRKALPHLMDLNLNKSIQSVIIFDLYKVAL